jgi:hypothetical protein
MLFWYFEAVGVDGGFPLATGLGGFSEFLEAKIVERSSREESESSSSSSELLTTRSDGPLLEGGSTGATSFGGDCGLLGSLLGGEKLEVTCSGALAITEFEWPT